MSAAAKALTGGSSELIIAADEYRDHITIQLQSAEPVYLGFNEDAVSATGVELIYPGCSVRVSGAKARLAIYGYAANASHVGIETHIDIEYRPGSYSYGA